MTEPLPITAQKTPGETLDYPLDYTEWLEGATISSSSWAVTPTGPTISSPQITGNITSCLLAGGTVDQTYTLTNTITSSNGKTRQVSRRIKIVSERYPLPN
jgi:hypothetical protein